MGKHETTMAGTAIASTLKHMSMIGDIGKEILLEFNINKINLKKEYSYKIRGAIQSAARKRFGKEALYFYGITMMDAYKEIIKKSGNDHQSIFIKKNFKKFNSNLIKISRSVRNDYMKMTASRLDFHTKASIFTPKENIVGCSSEVISRDVIEFTLINAVLYENECFNRGLISGELGILRKSWDINIKFLKSKSKQDKTGWCKFVWHITFLKNKKKVDLATIENEIRENAKQSFIQNVLKDSNLQKKRSELLTNQLSKFIPPQIHKAMIRGDFNTDIATKRKKLTVFFSDIKNFTATSESLQPEDLTIYLNEYFSEMTNIALRYGATIDKYIGDAVMLFFGDPSSKGEREDARACVEMALKMQEKMIELRRNWKSRGFLDPFKIRIGINTGYCNVGNFGSEQRLTYTIIGGEVNVAARLEAAGDADGILMSYETYAHVEDMIDVEQKEVVKMKGINRDVKVFSVLARKNEKIIETKTKEVIENSKVKEIEKFKKTIIKMDDEIQKMKKIFMDLKNIDK